MKMSKSLGNVEDPFELIKKFNINSVRSYFLSEGPLLKDSNFELEALIEHNNKVICDSYGNNHFTFINTLFLFPSLILLTYSKHLIQNYCKNT